MSAVPVDDPPTGPYSPGELVRWMQRIERALTELMTQVVAKGVYDVQRAAMLEDITELRSEFRDFKRASAEEIKAIKVDAAANHERLINRAWWLAATCAALALTVAGLWLKGN